MNNQSDIEALETFLEDPELERLEELADDFNIFTALGAVHSEIRHSNFLAWLLSPAESHGLGDYFLAGFLRELTRKASLLAIEAPSVFDIDSWKLDDAEVLREWRNIDILIRSDDHQFVCVLENKLHSGEGSDQLARYATTARAEFPSYRRLFAYLTVEGSAPSEADYVPLSYDDIASLVHVVIERKQDKLGSEILAFIAHYKEMLRRYIVEDSEIQEICTRIYRTHRKALDLIFEYKPDKQSEIHDCLVGIITRDPALILAESSKSSIRFLPREWDFIPKEGEGWGKIDRMLLFECYNSPPRVNLRLYIGPGPQEIREKLHEMAKLDPSLFNTAKRKLTEKWLTIYRKTLITPKEYDDKEVDELRQTLEERLTKLGESDFPRIERHLSTLGREMGWLEELSVPDSIRQPSVHKSDRVSQTYQWLVDIIERDPELILDHSSKSSVRFLPRKWDFIPKEGEGWGKTNRILLFECYNSPRGVKLRLYIGPGPQEIREKLDQMARHDPTLFNPARSKLPEKWLAIYRRDLIKPEDYDDKEPDELREILEQRLMKLKEDDFPRITRELSTLGRQMGWLAD